MTWALLTAALDDNAAYAFCFRIDRSGARGFRTLRAQPAHPLAVPLYARRRHRSCGGRYRDDAPGQRGISISIDESARALPFALTHGPGAMAPARGGGAM